METLYQILTTLHDAGIREPERRATLEEYTVYVDIIATKHKDAERRGLEAGGLQDQPEEGENHGRNERRSSPRPRVSREEEAEQVLRHVRKELLHKRRRSVSSVSSSSSDSYSGRKDGESNKKKRVYQSQLPWYTAEIAAEAREVDENRRKTRETLAVFQKDLNFAE